MSPKSERVLIICTANICRSRMAEVLLRDRIGELGVDAEVFSAGLLPGGREVPEEVVRVLAPLVDRALGDPSKQLGADDLRSADLVLCMAREHLREAVVTDRVCWPRCATLREFVRRAGAHKPRAAGETLSGFAARVLGGRVVSDLLGDSEADDVADPYGGSIDDYRSTEGEIRSLIAQLAVALWPAAQGATGGSSAPLEPTDLRT